VCVLKSVEPCTPPSLRMREPRPPQARQFRATLHGAARLRAEVVGLFPLPRFPGGEARAAQRRRGPVLVAANRASGRAPLVQRGAPALECCPRND